MSKTVRALAVVSCLFLSACARTGHLYPANEAAGSTGVLEAHFMAYGTGHGQGEVLMPDGELLSGEYSLVRGGTIGFGTIYASVYGPRGVASATATSATYEIPGGSPGMASMYGNRGTIMTCEFYNDNYSGHGYGACKSSRGALYRIQY